MKPLLFYEIFEKKDHIFFYFLNLVYIIRIFFKFSFRKLNKKWKLKNNEKNTCKYKQTCPNIK